MFKPCWCVFSTGLVTTYAGVGQSSGFVDGPATSAKFYGPSGIAIDTNGVLFVSDHGNSCMRIVSTSGMFLIL
jgi:hypothetical protein